MQDPEDSLSAEDSDKDRYLITYADLITLLLGLFIILYAISKVDSNKYAKMVTAIGNTFGRSGQVLEKGGKFKSDLPAHPSGLKENLNRLVNQYNYSDHITLEENERGITIHILDDVLFQSGNADLSTGSKLVLSRLAVILKKLPNDFRIEGHTDDVPINSASFPSNWHLSVARALNTAYYLVNTEGLLPEKVSIVGNSEYKPIASNETVEGRASNRRVDIVIIKK
ncbi:MAG: OmpA family protein [Ignavibacteriaceae bacterium]|jgi:chemotaxis protein MotB|nr:OmpA family protein [Ignavibacteriaceae bacterium]